MPNFYDMQDADTMMVDEGEFYILDDIEDFVIDEYDAVDQEAQFVVEEQEEDMTNDRTIPGTNNVQYIEDEQEAETQKDWTNDGDHSQFVDYVKDKLQKVPRHSGETVPGCERAKSFLKSIDSEISKAMRSDLNGVVDEQEVDRLRKSIEDMVDRLDKQVKKLTGTKRASLDVRLVSEGHCDKCNASAPMWHDVSNDNIVCMSCDSSLMKDESDIEKTASTPSINVYVTAFERAIVGTIINSKVSAGRNIEETYDRLKNKYNFTPREELAMQQLIADYGYPVYKDRGLLNEPSDPAANDGVDWAANYHA